jgi:hypothetical protein
MKETKALTKPDELNFGKHIGSQDAEADEFTIEGEWMVFIKI